MANSDSDSLADDLCCVLKSTLEGIAPYRDQIKKTSQISPLYKHYTASGKAICQRVQTIWHSTNTTMSYSKQQDSFRTDKKRPAHASIKVFFLGQQKNSKVCISCCCKLTGHHNFIETCHRYRSVTSGLPENFPAKSSKHLAEIQHSSQSVVPITNPPIQRIAYPLFMNFKSMASSKSTTSLLNPFPTKLLKDVLLEVNHVFQSINFSLSTGVVHQ